MLPIAIFCYAMLPIAILGRQLCRSARRCGSTLWRGSSGKAAMLFSRHCGEGARGRQLCCLAGTVERELKKSSDATPLVRRCGEGAPGRQLYYAT